MREEHGRKPSAEGAQEGGSRMGQRGVRTGAPLLHLHRELAYPPPLATPSPGPPPLLAPSSAVLLSLPPASHSGSRNGPASGQTRCTFRGRVLCQEVGLAGWGPAGRVVSVQSQMRVRLQSLISSPDL